MSRVKTGFMLFMSDVVLDGEALTNAARYDRGFFKFSTEILETPGSLEPPVLWDAKVTAQYVDPIRALNPTIKIGLYAFAPVFARPWDPAYVFGADAQLLHKPDGTDLIYDAGVVPDIVHYRWVNYGREGVRADHAALYRAFCETYDLDGVFFDSWNPQSYADWVALPDNGSNGFFDLPGGLQEGPYHLKSSWQTVLTHWTSEVRDALNADGREVWVNGIGDYAEDAFLGTFHANVLEYADGALDEGIITTYGDATIFARTIAGMRLAQATGGETFYLAMPWLWTLSPPAFAIPDDTTLRRFWLATVLIGGNTRSHFGFLPYATVAYFGFSGSEAVVPWYDEFDLDFGVRTGRHFDGGTTLPWWCEFTAGFAVVNPTSTPQMFRQPGTYRMWHPETGARVVVEHGSEDTHVDLPAYSGTFFFHDRAA